MLRTFGRMPYWRIVFSTFSQCMSFHTGWTRSGHSEVDCGHCRSCLQRIDACASISRAQERLDGTTFIHRAITLRYLVKRERQVENLARMNGAVPDEVNQFRQQAPHH